MDLIGQFIADVDAGRTPTAEASKAAADALRCRGDHVSDSVDVGEAELALSAQGWELHSPRERARSEDYWQGMWPISVMDSEEAAKGNLDAARRTLLRIYTTLVAGINAGKPYSDIEIGTLDATWLMNRLKETLQRAGKEVRLVRPGRGRPRLDSTRRTELLAANLRDAGYTPKEAAELTIAMKPSIERPESPTPKAPHLVPLNLDNENDAKAFDTWRSNSLKPGRKLKKRMAYLKGLSRINEDKSEGY